jgi:hypothetical protein
MSTHAWHQLKCPILSHVNDFAVDDQGACCRVARQQRQQRAVIALKRTLFACMSTLFGTTMRCSASCGAFASTVASGKSSNSKPMPSRILTFTRTMHTAYRPAFLYPMRDLWLTSLWFRGRKLRRSAFARTFAAPAAVHSVTPAGLLMTGVTNESERGCYLV